MGDMELLFVICLFHLSVLLEATGGGGRPSSSSAQTENAVRYPVSEHLPTGSKIGNLVVDSGLKRKYPKDVIQQLEFRFLAEPPIPISLGPFDGIIRTKGAIDRDTMPLCRQRESCEVNLDVTVQPVAYFRIIKVTLDIQDINDNPPRFGESHHAFIPILESASIGSTFLLPSATDPDSPLNGVQHYQLLTTSPKFELKVTPKLDGFLDVRLLLKERLDREMEDEYQLRLIAYDGGQPPKTDSINVTVRVLDSNDNDPVFLQDNYEVTIIENMPLNSIILRVSAADVDSGANGQVVYGLTAQTEQLFGKVFAIRNLTGEIYLAGQVDRELSDVYQLTVTAEDQGTDSHPVDATVIVTVADLNDNQPKITVNTLTTVRAEETIVPENSPVGTFVAHITVTDPDAGRNGSVSCRMTSGQFSLVQRPLLPQSETEYQLLTSAALDRETIDSYNVSIVCSDAGEPAQIGIKQVQVRVGDVNDNAPIFERENYSASIIENNFIGAAILQVNATDPDLGENRKFRFAIVGQGASLFSIDQRGTVFAKEAFDRETTSVHRFQVAAIDAGSPARTGSARVVVKVEDVNDERPVFIHPSYSFSVLENEPVGRSVGSVSARDRDLPPMNVCTYAFRGETPSTDSFSIDPRNGTIWTRRTLDRENQPVYHLIVIVFEPDMTLYSSTANVIVSVIDTNDNAPVFEFPTPINHTVFISSRVPVGYVAALLSATDPDIDTNARLTYRLLGVSDATPQLQADLDYFRVDPIQGSVFVTRDLNSLDHHVFRLTVAAVDHGLPAQSVSARLSVVVNNSIPFFADRRQPETDLLTGSNLIIVVSIGCGVFLLVACIVVVGVAAAVRRAKRERGRGKYSCRMEPVDMLTVAPNDFIGASSIEGTPVKKTPPADGPVNFEKPDALSFSRLQSQQWSVWSARDLQVICPGDKDSIPSAEGSYTDSGRGPSEEGDQSKKAATLLAYHCTTATSSALNNQPPLNTTPTARGQHGTTTFNPVVWSRQQPATATQQYRHVPGSNCAYTTSGPCAGKAVSYSRVRSLTLPPQPISFQPRKGILRDAGPPNGISRNISTTSSVITPAAATAATGYTTHSLGKGSSARQWFGSQGNGLHGNVATRRAMPSFSVVDTTSGVTNDDRSTVIV